MLNSKFLPLKPWGRPYTSFEADRKLVQFAHMPFGVTNGVSYFHRKMEQFFQLMI